MSAAVLAAAETMSDAGRWRHMLNLGRRAMAEPVVQAHIAALAADVGYYPRRLALMATHASGDREIILAALTGASSALAGLAIKLAARMLDDETLARVLPDLPASRRRKLARACAARRPAAVEGAFWQLAAADRAKLVAYASSAFVADRLADADFAGRLAAMDWARIARRHQDPVIAALVRRLEAQAEPPRALLQSVNSVLAAIDNAPAPGALDLLRAAAARTPLSGLAYRGLAPHFPAEIAALILADRHEPWAILRKVDDGTRKALLRQRGRGVSAGELRKLSPASRRDLYDEGLLEPGRNSAGALPREVVRLLPASVRIAEARRAWAAPQLRAHPGQRLPYLAFLPFAEALAEAGPFVSDPDGEVRAIACAAVIGAGRYEASRLGDILAFVHARRNEQDPVRLAMLTALAGLPPTRWREEHLGGISQVVDAALSARDASAQTLDDAGRWLVQMAPQRIGFVGRELTRIAEKLGRVPRVSLEERLSDSQMAVLAPELLPLLQVWRDRSQVFAVTGLLANFGRRLKASPPLVEFLADMTGDPRGPMAVQAFDTLVSARAQARLRTLIPTLLRDDPSWILANGVAPWIGRHRQDLLSEFLTPRLYGGRFSYHQTAVLPGFSGDYHRWSERQQKAYGAALIQVAEGGRRSVWELRSAVDKIAAMPAGEVEPIVRLARLDAEDKALRDMAVTALGKLDGARGVAALVQALDDDRGRIAIYALRGAVLDMPAAQAIGFLRRAPLNKVTVAKEVLRLAGDVGGDAGWAFLADFSGRTDLHKDVRIALLRALWAYLERESVWSIFAEAAAADAGAARATAHIPDERLSEPARVRLAGHLKSLLHHPSPVVRLEVLRRLATSPVQPAPPGLLVDLATLLDDATDEEAGHAVTALLLCAPLADVADLADILGRDCPPRLLQVIVSTLCRNLSPARVRVEPLADRLADRLIGQGRQITLATRLAARAAPREALPSMLQRLSDRGLLHPGALTEAMAGVGLRSGADRAGLERAFAAAADPMLRRIGLALLVATAGNLGWSPEARERLDAYRADPAPLVAEAAELVFPPDEAPAAA